jgi:hypothetical protein
MEILLTLATLLTIVVLVILIGTKGRPTRFISQFGEFIIGIRENRIQLLVFSSLIVMFACVVYLFFMMPDIGAGPVQPISFSHRLHAGDKNIDCRFCHSYVDRSIHPGMPPVEKCLFCHNYVIPNHPEIQKEHYYFDNDIPIPWKKVFILPEHVVFNHERHIKQEIACDSCHGTVKAVNATDRLTHHEFEMGFCVECHQSKDVNVDCWLSCHN